MLTLSLDLKKSIFSPVFLFGLIGMIIAIFFGAYDKFFYLINNGFKEGLTSGFHFEALIDTLESSAVLFCLPVFCVLPCATSVVNDFDSGFIKLYIYRTNKKKYINSKALTAIISGGLLLVFAILSSYLIFFLLFAPAELSVVAPVGNNLYYLNSETIINGPSYLSVILRTCTLFFLSGSLWSIIGLTMATLFKSKYIGYVSSFIIYYLLVIMCERYFRWLYVFHPKEWVFPEKYWPFCSLGVFILLIELIIISFIIFKIICTRRFKFE